MPDAKAGRKLKCPHCREVLAVPVGGKRVMPAATIPAPTSTPAVEKKRPQTVIPVQCLHCGRSLRVPEKKAGRKIKCPHCRGVVAIPADGKPVVPLPAPTSAPADEAEQRVVAAPSKPLAFQEQGPSSVTEPAEGKIPKRVKARGSKSARVRSSLRKTVMRRGRGSRSRRRVRRRRLRRLAQGVAGLFLGGLAVYLLFLAFYTPPPEPERKSYTDLDPVVRQRFTPTPLDKELSYLPDQIGNLNSLRVEPLQASHIYRELRQAMPDRVEEAEQRATLGHDFAFADLARWTQAHARDGQVRILTTRRPVTAKDILARRPAAPTQQRRFKGRIVYEFPHGGDFCVAEPHVVLYGRSELLGKILERGGPPKLSAGMTAAMALADFSQTSVTIVEQGLWGRELGPLGTLDPAALLPRKPDGAVVVSHVAWTTEITATDLILTRDARAATRAKKAAETQLETLLSGDYPKQNQLWTTLQFAVNGDMLVLTNAVKLEDLPSLDVVLPRPFWMPEVVPWEEP